MHESSQEAHRAKEIDHGGQHYHPYSAHASDSSSDRDDIPMEHSDLIYKMEKLNQNLLNQHTLVALSNFKQKTSLSKKQHRRRHSHLSHSSHASRQSQYSKDRTDSGSGKYKDPPHQNSLEVQLIESHNSRRSASQYSPPRKSLIQNEDQQKKTFKNWKKKSQKLTVQQTIKNLNSQNTSYHFYEVHHSNGGRRQQITQNNQIDLSQYNGRGILIVKEGKKYQGEWENGTLISPVKITYPSGDIYNGDVFHYKKHGKGQLQFVNGKKYIGQFSYGDIDGYGIYYNKKGKIITEGEWKRGKFFR